MNKKIFILIKYYIFFACNIFSAINARADEPEITCEAFVKEEICKMTPEEQEIWFLELLEKILEDTIEKKKTKEGTDI